MWKLFLITTLVLFGSISVGNLGGWIYHIMSWSTDGDIQRAKSIFAEITTNFKSKPIQNLFAVPFNENCPQEHEILHMKPEVKSMAGQMLTTVSNMTRFTVWKNQLFCVQYLNSSFYYKSSAEECKFGYKQCTPNFCSSVSEQCPITSFQITQNLNLTNNFQVAITRHSSSPLLGLEIAIENHTHIEPSGSVDNYTTFNFLDENYQYDETYKANSQFQLLPNSILNSNLVLKKVTVPILADKAQCYSSLILNIGEAHEEIESHGFTSTVISGLGFALFQVVLGAYVMMDEGEAYKKQIVLLLAGGSFVTVGGSILLGNYGLQASRNDIYNYNTYSQEIGCFGVLDSTIGGMSTSHGLTTLLNLNSKVQWLLIGYAVIFLCCIIIHAISLKSSHSKTELAEKDPKKETEEEGVSSDEHQRIIEEEYRRYLGAYHIQW